MPKMSANEYAEPDPSGWFVQYRDKPTQVFKHNAKYHCCVDQVNANPNQIKPDATLNQYEYRYISPDKQHSVLVTFEDKDTLFGPYINENSEVDYGISYKQALELFASCGITLDTPQQIEQAMFMLDPNDMQAAIRTVNKKTAEYGMNLVKQAMIPIIKQTNFEQFK